LIMAGLEYKPEFLISAGAFLLLEAQVDPYEDNFALGSGTGWLLSPPVFQLPFSVGDDISGPFHNMRPAFPRTR